MSNSQDDIGMPLFKCHKTVRAAKITGFRENGTDAPDIILGEIGAIISMDKEWHERHKPHIGGYFVGYNDGYHSFSPANAFEDGYSLI